MYESINYIIFQVKELKKKLVEINISSVVAPPEDLRLEYEKQIENIRKLRTLYEERAAATLLEHRREMEREEAKISVLETKLSDVQTEIEEYKVIKKELEAKIETLENTLQQNEDELEKTKDDLFSSTAQNSSLNSQMTLINNLFSHMLVRPEVDLDRLTRHLNEHHGLITDLTMTGDSNEVAALLMDLAEQMDKEKESDEKEENNGEVSCYVNEPLQSEIASNLSKVWRVMIELLSHHQTPSPTEPAGGVDSCYKSIQTPSGPRSVISVSQTFLTLKDLILEKNKLVKEVGRLKTLNNHLEHRLGSQEKRLSVVTTELRKTWAVVNKLKAQHKQLHTHEKILRYELQQKRCMLTELKGELEHCRDKWEKARQKNSQTEEDWKKLRKEFAARKSRNESNSAESGYEEDDVQSPPSESNKFGRSLYELPSSGVSEPELSEEDIEHSDGNSFDTVIDLLDLACLENQQDNQTEVPFVLCDVPSQALEIPQNLLPLTGSEFTEGLDQIESEDLAAVLDIQYQTQLLGADYNLSLPSSSGSSPIPTENDDFTSSEVDISEEDMSTHDNHIYSSPMPNANNSISEDILLFGSNSSKNISLFLDGLFVNSDQNLNNTKNSPPHVSLDIPSTSKVEEESKHVNLSIGIDESSCHCADDLTPIVSEDNLYIFSRNDDRQICRERRVNGNILENEEFQVNTLQSPSHSPLQHQIENQSDISETSVKKPVETVTEPENKTQEELLKAREERLKRLEHQCRCLVNKVTSTSFRSEIISNKLDELHLAYGPVQHDENDELKNEEKDNSDLIKITKYESSYPKSSSSKEFCSLQNKSFVETDERCILPSNSTNTNEIACSNKTTPSNENYIQTTKLNTLEDQCTSLFHKSSRIESFARQIDDPYTSASTIATSVSPTELNLHIPSSSNVNSEETTEICQFKDKKTASLKQKEDIESKPPDLAFESSEILNQCSLAGPSVDPEQKCFSSIKKGRTPEEILEARAERFKRLEDQCKSLLSKMTATSLRSEIISNKLDELHSCYGSSEDASDNEEHSLSKNADKRLTSSSSSRCYKKSACIVEGDKESTKGQNMTDTNLKSQDLTDSGLEDVNVATRKCIDDNNGDGNTVLLNRISEEMSSTQEQRFDTPCLAKLPTASTVPDVITNQKQELHILHCPTPTSELTSMSHNTPTVCRVQQDEDNGSESFTNTSKLHTDTNVSDCSNKTQE